MFRPKAEIEEVNNGWLDKCLLLDIKVRFKWLYGGNFGLISSLHIDQKKKKSEMLSTVLVVTIIARIL